MNTRRIAIAVTATALLTILFVWLSGDSPLARVASLNGAVDRDRHGSEEKWFAANLGDELAMGDAVRTGKKSLATLEMSEGTVLKVAPGTVIRLLSDAPKRDRFRVESGSAEVQAGEAEVMFETARGSVQVERGAKVTISQDDGDTWVRVDMGRAQLGWEAEQKVLEQGQEVRAHGDSKAKTKPTLAEALPKANAAEPTTPPEALPRPTEPAPHPAPSAAGLSAVVRGKQVKIQEKGEKNARGIAEGQHVLAVGTLVTVDGDSALELSQAEGGSLVTQGKASLVVGDGAKVATRVLNGKLRARAGKVPLEVEVPGGRILLMVDDAGGAASSVQVGKTGVQVNADRGTVVLRGKGAEKRLSKGAQGSLTTRGEALLDYHPPSMRDMMLVAGTSTTVHDPNPPTAIALQLGSACGTAATVVEQQTPRGFQVRAEGTDAALVWFPLGSTSYRLRCKTASGEPGKTVASGKVLVQRDGAARRVTKRAPELEVDLDGRKYTAVYQTLLPRIRVRVPPGASGDLSLRIEGTEPAKTLKLPVDGLTLESGTLGEGSHTLSLVGKTLLAAKKPTTVSIRFDNAAPAAYLEGEGALKQSANGSVELSGAALDDSQISIDGKPVVLDRAARFEARVVPDAGARGVGLWIKHPRLGSHHYVRRVQGRDQVP
jgi:hypothetical protein